MRPDSLQPAAPPEEASIDLLRLLAVFTAEWRTGLLVGAIVFLIGAAITFTRHSQYEASATLLPKESVDESNSLSAVFSGRHPGAVYVGLLSSRSVLDNVINRLDLMHYYHLSSHAAARGMLLKNTKVSIGGDSLIAITVRNRDANDAMKICNAFIDALQAQQERMALSQSALHRHFFERQMADEKEALNAAEVDLRKLQETTGVIQMDTQTQIGLNAIAGTRAQITTLQVQLAALLQSSTEENPQVRTLRSQIAQLEIQERALESKAGTGGTGAAAPAGRMPQLNLEYQRRAREVKYHETLFNSLSNQFEAARLSEASSVDVFQVVDRAIVPENPSYPPRNTYLLAALVVAILAALVSITVKLLGRRLLQDPDQRENLQLLRRSVSLRRHRNHR